MGISNHINNNNDNDNDNNFINSNSPGHNQNLLYDFLSSDWLTQNQNIAQTEKGLRPREMAAMSRRKPLQIYSWYDRILPIYLILRK